MVVRRAGDGGPLVRVHVDGREVDRIVRADTDAGSVLQCIGHTKRGHTYKLRYRRIQGRVTLEPMFDAQEPIR